jgi:rhodanese-related sulfurtransferase
LLDVREDNEWAAGHAAEQHLGKGFSNAISSMFPDPRAEIIMYCGGGYRSA